MADRRDIVRERDVIANGIRLRVREQGAHGASVPSLLLLHGINDRWESWEPVISALAARYHVIAPDLRGHARSDKPDDGYALADYAADAAGLLDALNVGRVCVIGHSLGALIAAYLAAEMSDRVHALVLEDPPLCQHADIDEWARLRVEAQGLNTAEQTAAMLRDLAPDRPDADIEQEAEWLRATAQGPFIAILTGEIDLTSDQSAMLRRIACPTLVLQADPADGGVLSDEAVGRAMAALRRGSHQAFPQTGHVIHRDRSSDFVAAVERFFDTMLEEHVDTGDATQSEGCM